VRSVRGALTPRNAIGGLRALVLVRHPIEYLRRYFVGGGVYPCEWQIRTPTGLVRLATYSHADVLTIFVCFLRGDYSLHRRQAAFIVDVGANIGISAAYFLSRSRRTRVVCVEPVAMNIARLKKNLAPFEGRYSLIEAAVADFAGEATFGVESTGVFGGIGVPSNETITVRCEQVNDLLRLPETCGTVDVLKMDIEGYEIRTARAIDHDVAERIRLVFLEAAPTDDLLPATHRQRQRGAVCVLERTP
jgi:FkbM family methyltransferase